MNKFLSTLVPLVLAAAAATSLAWWLLTPPPGEGLRLPETQPSLSQAATSGPTELRGKLAVGDGQAAKIQGSWPAFRGERGDGVSYEATALAKAFPPAGLKPIWSLEMGEGYAGAAVRNGRVYVLDYDAKSSSDALRCFSPEDGKEIWRFSYPEKVKRNHGMSRTVPAVTDKYVVTLGPKCQVVCLDAASGQLRWSRDLVNLYKTTVPLWYAGQCPLIDGDRVILAPSGPGALMVAVDLESGKDIWAKPAPNKHNWQMTHVSIVPMEFGGRRMYVYCGSGGVAGVSVEDGSILWESDAWKIATATVPSPVVVGQGRIFCSGGYNAGAVMLQLKQSGPSIVAEAAFRLPAKVFGATQQTPILYKGYLYGVRADGGELVCMDLTGKVVWASTGQNFGLGPFLIAGDLIYLMNDEGELTLAHASPDGYKRLSHAKVLGGPESWGPMALAGGRLIVRDLMRMVCLDVSAK